MEENIKSSLRFIDYRINDIEFHLNNEYQDGPTKVAFDIKRDVKYLEDKENTMLVTLVLNIFENASENNYPFSLYLNATGIFELDHVSAEKRETFAEVNAVAILFPYLRSLVSTYTANSNVPALILPPINVIKLIEEQNETFE